MTDTAPRKPGAPDRDAPLADTGSSSYSGSRSSSLRPDQGAGKDDSGVRGRTTIADGVVEKIAGLATRDVPGVHALGSGLSRTFGAVRDRVPGGSAKAVTRGVKAEVGEVQTAIDLEIVVVYGVSIADVAGDVRENVVEAVERMTGLEVVEVNIAVSDVKLPDEEEDEEPESRLQ